jgi:hypothetical protein
MQNMFQHVIYLHNGLMIFSLNLKRDILMYSRAFYTQIHSMIHGYVPSTSTRCKRGTIKRPNGPTDREIQQARAMLATRICDYNQANLFLASVIRKTVSKKQALFPLLHQYITKNTHLIANDAHALLYAVKREMSHTLKTLSNKVYNEMQQLQIAVDSTLPLIRPYISKLHALSTMHRRLGG